MPDRATGVTELRLALVCYGGVSLAIYMHGMTKELHKLVSASRAFDEAGREGENPFGADDSRSAYFEALRELADEDRYVSVGIDVVAGTSAGGINGVVLAKVLARNGSQDALKQLWIDEGDLKTLLNAPAIGGWKVRAALAALKLLGKLQKPGGPLRGDRMSQLLYDAIAKMDAPADTRRSLIRPDGSLDLYVTTTDLDGFTVVVPTGTGGAAQRETEHAQVVQFHADSDGGDLGTDSVGALAFAARATSCFPGAFPPVSLASFQQEIGSRAFVPSAVSARFRNRYQAGGGSSDSAYFVDGGVLDNAPFELVVQAIGRKRADNEVVRRLVYIQPDPGRPLGVASSAPPPAVEAKGYVEALKSGVLGAKGSHSILRDLVALRDLNLRIAQIGAIARVQMGQVTSAIDQAWQAGTSTTDRATPEHAWDINSLADVKLLADTIYDDATHFVGAAFPSYCRLKVDAAAARLASEIAERFEYPKDSSRSSFVNAALAAWARTRIDGDKLETQTLLTMLGPVDVPYRERRLMFILAGLNGLYAEVGKGEHPARAELDQLKDRAWTLLEQLRAAPREAVVAADADVAFLGSALSDEAVFDNPEAFARAHDAEFTQVYRTYARELETRLGDSSAPLWQAFVELTAQWPVEHRKSLLSRFLGFPLWDSLIFPTIALSELPQFSPIPVSQFSPAGAGALTAAGGKLKGVTLHHFGAFTEAAWRENDYLWGRLDAAELILRTLRDTGSPVGSVAPPATAAEAAASAGPQLRPALAAILASEQDLARVAALRASLATQVESLPG
jgi:patatin-related protein